MVPRPNTPVLSNLSRKFVESAVVFIVIVITRNQFLIYNNLNQQKHVLCLYLKLNKILKKE